MSTLGLYSVAGPDLVHWLPEIWCQGCRGGREGAMTALIGVVLRAPAMKMPPLCSPTPTDLPPLMSGLFFTYNMQFPPALPGGGAGQCMGLM